MTERERAMALHPSAGRRAGLVVPLRPAGVTLPGSSPVIPQNGGDDTRKG